MDRIEKLRAQFNDLRIDAFLVTDPVNQQYLTDFDGEGVILVTTDQTTIITDERFKTLLEQQAGPYQIIITRDYLGQAAKEVERQGVTVLGFEDTLSFHDYDQLDELMSSDIVPMSTLIERQREIKSASELEQIQLSTQLALKGFEQLLPFIQPGISELAVANRLDSIMRQLGATKASFDTIVASGARAALPHGAATSRILRSGELVTIDFGYFVNGYTSDVTRTIALGQPDKRLREIYNVVKAAQALIIDAIAPGVSGQELDRIGRDYITRAGYDAYFNHGTGHGIGLAIHEGPAISTRSTDLLVPNQVITIEPGIYLPELGGVRIEDDVLVTEDSHQILTASNTDLIVL